MLHDWKAIRRACPDTLCFARRPHGSFMMGSTQSNGQKNITSRLPTALRGYWGGQVPKALLSLQQERGTDHASPSWPCTHSPHPLPPPLSAGDLLGKGDNFQVLFSVSSRLLLSLQSIERSMQCAACFCCTRGEARPAKALCACRGSLSFTFRENVAHAEDSHQVVNITVDALGDSRVLQDRMREDSVEAK